MRSLLALFFLAVSVHAGVVAGPERPVSAPSFAAGSGINLLSALTTDGTDFLTVWSDDTPGRQGLYAAVVNEAGATRPFAPQPIFRGSGLMAHAVWTGNAYLVIVHGNSASTVMRLDRDARVIAGPAPLEVQRPIGSLAWNGRVALATTSDPETGTSAALLLDADGRLLRSILLPGLSWSSAVAAGEAFVVVRPRYEFEGAPFLTLSAIRVSEDGAVSEPVELVRLNGVTFGMAADAERLAVAYVAVAGTQYELRRFTFDAETFAGQTHPPVPLPRSLSNIGVVASADGFLASWMYTAAATQQTMLDSIGFDASTTPRTVAIPNVGPVHFALESNGRTAFAAWGGGPVRGIAFDAALTRNTTSVTQIATSPVRQNLPALASTPDMSLLAWLEPTNHRVGNVVVRRFDRAGNALGAQPLDIGSNAEWYVPPAVAFTGKVWLVAWQSGRSLPEMHIYVRRLALDGTPLDPLPIDAGLGLYPALASNGKVAVLAMAAIGRNGIAAIRFNADGQRIDATPLPIDDDRGYSPKLATNGREFLAVWEASPIKPERPIGIIGVRFGEDGAPLDPKPIEIALAYKNDQPHVASNGTDFLVTYTNYRPPVYDDPNPLPVVYRVHAKRVLRSGVLADHTAQAQGYLLGKGRESQVAKLGQTYAVTIARELALNSDTRYTLHAVRTDERGAAAETQEIPNGESYAPEHALVSHGNTVTLVYPRVEPSLSHVQRLFLRTIVADDPTPGRRRSARK
ncbi:MAG TPA: hypothetical protein VF883_14455 [Thermoanaerobaculia bacterium]|jgi:hypothetical protein